ncbi:hypothetical protein MalM25_28760 [Planctomycetes bacterium MalM25]|nr:hypothetical protein MalM25_28760 [Planctomycetes bacterium MalM25]
MTGSHHHHDGRLAWLAAALLGTLAAAPEAYAQEPAPPAQAETAPRRAVALVRIALPLTGTADAIAKARLQRAVDRLLAEPAEKDRRPLLVIELQPEPDGGESEFERALSLARFLVDDEMARVKTLAYLPDTVEGHAVLVALACEEIAMAPEAQLGRAAAGEDASRPIGAGIRGSYQQIAETRRTAPPAIATAMVDRSAELIRVESDRGVEYALRDEVETLRNDRAIISEEVIAPAGTLAVFTGREAREEGLAKYLVSDRDALARALAVPGAALLEDEALAGDWRPVMVDLGGPLTTRAAKRIENLLGDQLERHEVNWIGLRIDSSTGDLNAALRLAQTLAELGDGEARTVAYVPKRAEGPAALVALACDQLVMQTGAVLRGAKPEGAQDEAAEIEDPEPDDPVPDDQDEPIGEENAEAPEAADEEQAPLDVVGRRVGEALERLANDGDDPLAAARATIRDNLAPACGRSWSVLMAAIDPAIELSTYTNRSTGAERLYSPEEIEALPDGPDWRRGAALKPADKALSLTAERASEFGVAWRQVEQFDDLQALYGFDDPPPTAEPNWALELVEALASPGLAALLLVIGVVGMYLELNTPGLGLGGFIATVALGLFFWSKFLDGTADWLEVLLFVMGLVFVLIELIVLPGFGVFGLGGALLIVASLVLASQTFILPQTESQLAELRNSLATVAGAGVIVMLGFLLLRQYLPQSPLFRHAMLGPLDEADRIELDRREQLADYGHLVGKRGVATTDLLPAGRAEIDGEPVDVLSQGEPIERGDAIEVLEAHANRVVVRRVNA